MDYKTYQPLALRTAKLFGDKKLDLQHAVIGLMTELGEFIDAAFAGDDAGTGEELADMYWYAALMCHTKCVTLDEVMRIAPHAKTEDNYNEMASLGAVATYVKRVAIYDKAPTEEMEVNLLYDLSALMNRIGRDFTEVEISTLLAANIDKLRLRYPDKYSDEAAEARADKNGADCRNS